MYLTDEDRRDPYFNHATGESLRTLVAEYAEQAGELSDQVISQVLHWHQWRAAEGEFDNTFPEVIYFGGYAVARNLRDFQEDVYPWLQASVGSGGYWNYEETHNPRDVIIDPTQRDWAWAQFGYSLGFKRAPDAMMFKIAFDTPVDRIPVDKQAVERNLDMLRQRLRAKQQGK